MIASGLLSTWTATRSPRPTPLRASAAAIRPLIAQMSAKVKSRPSPFRMKSFPGALIRALTSAGMDVIAGSAA